MTSSFTTSRRKRKKDLSRKFHQFLSTHAPARVNRHLRCILLDYLTSQLESGLPVDFDKYIWELYDLFELLDDAAADYPLH